MIFVFGVSWRFCQPTCVLESDFGFTINCAFKKSGLFRVRNLGGVKSHISLGFTVGDELGFKESLSNTEALNRRRSVQSSKLQNQILKIQQEMQSGKAGQNEKEANNKASERQGHASSLKFNTSAIIPPFKPIPKASEKPVPEISKGKIPASVIMDMKALTSNGKITSLSNEAVRKRIISALTNSQVPEKISSQHLALRTLPGSISRNDLVVPVSANSLSNILAVHNVSEEALEEALIQRQKLLLAAKAKMTTTTTTTTTTTLRPSISTSRISTSIGKVMNAPREYYPVGYDKNFDDNFASRVDLPETSFYCGDQKYFPGLYADEDLGCMVFHVCALTDDGLIMKSFLCPESTLFDNSILKCNWWFYVDCKNSKNLYDANIPISKSYQLIKALTFFTGYKKDSGTNSTAAPEKD